MKSVISSTYDNIYFYLLPITVWAWNKIGVDAICFMPDKPSRYNYNKYLEWAERSMLIHNTILKQGLKCEFKYFISDDDKQATYAQCSRLFAACLPELNEDEVLISGDVDMAVFGEYLKLKNGDFDIFGNDLCPGKQFPICFISASVKKWRKAFDLELGFNISTSAINNSLTELKIKTYQQCLDELLGNITAEHFRGNYWGKDQETAYNEISSSPVSKYYHSRARQGTQFADNRVDRDDINWRSYVNENLVDAHLWRNGYEEQNHKNIIELLTTMYPNDSFEWLETYRNEYLKLL